MRPDPTNPAVGLRLFVAVPLPPSVVARAASIIARLAESGGGVRWTDPRRLHLTLAFLGDEVTEERVPAIATAIDEGCRGIPPLVVACGGLGRFPAAGRPRVVWLGVTEGAAELIRLQEAVAGQLEGLGFPREARGWQPHVTLGRVPARGRSGASSAARLESAIAEAAECVAGSGIVGEVVLYASVRTPAGPVYRALHTTPLARG